MALCSLSLILALQGAPKIRPYQMVIYTSGYEQASAGEQAGHLKFLSGLWESRKALAVGPFAEKGRLRGLVILDCKTRDEAKQIMANDPLVQAKGVTPQIFTWWTEEGHLHKGPSFMDLERHTFGFLIRPKSAPSFDKQRSAEIQEGHMANMKVMHDLGLLRVAGPFEDAGAYRGIFIFRGTDLSQIQAAAAKDPAIASGALKLVTYTLMLPKGTLEN